MYVAFSCSSPSIGRRSDSPEVGATGHGAHEEASLTFHNLLGAETRQRWVMDP